MLKRSLLATALLSAGVFLPIPAAAEVDAPEIYRVLPFLRCLNRITVFGAIDGQTFRLYEVQRKLTHQDYLPDGTIYERWLFNTFHHNQPSLRLASMFQQLSMLTSLAL